MLAFYMAWELFGAKACERSELSDGEGACAFRGEMGPRRPLEFFGRRSEEPNSEAARSSAQPKSFSALKIQLLMFVAGLCAGLAFMVKGPLGILMPGGAIGVFLLWRRDWKALLVLPWAALFGAAIVALPWALAQHAAAPDFWRYFIMVEHFGRLAGEGGERHAQHFWFYIPVLVGGMMPFGLFAWSLVKGGLALDWRDPAKRFLVCWIAVPFVGLSLSSGKLGTYILPIFPALALLTLACLKSSYEKHGPKSFDVVAKCLFYLFFACALLCAPLAILGAGGVWTPPFGIEFHRFILPLLVAALLLSGVALGHRPLFRSQAPKGFSDRMAAFCFACALLMVAWPCALTPALENSVSPVRFIERTGREISAATKVYATPELAGAVSWALRRSDVELFRKPGEFVYGLEKSGRKLLSPEELKAILERPPSGDGVAVFIPKRLYGRLFEDLKAGGALSLSESGSFMSLIVR
jgi:4-amino-4-deoxy-L-arabinose transferase